MSQEAWASYQGRIVVLEEKWLFTPEHWGPVKVLMSLGSDWERLPSLPGSRNWIYDFAFSGEDITVLAGLDYGLSLRLMSLAQGSGVWSPGPEPFSSMEITADEVASAKLARQEDRSWAVAAVFRQEVGCGDALDFLYGGRCLGGDCDAPTLLERPAEEDSAFYVDDLLASKGPEDAASIVYTASGDGDGLPFGRYERSLPNGGSRRFISSDSIGNPALLLVDSTLFLLGLESSDAYPWPHQLWSAARSKNAKDWTMDLLQLPSLAGASQLSACRMGTSLVAVWGPTGPENVPARLHFAIQAAGQWGEEREVPGTTLCSGCYPDDEALTGLALACTTAEMHVVWSTPSQGVRHVAYSPLGLESASLGSGGVLRIEGRGFAADLEAWLGDEPLEVLEVRARFVLVRAPALLQGVLKIQNPDGESSTLAISLAEAKLVPVGFEAWMFALVLLGAVGWLPRRWQGIIAKNAHG